MSGSESLDPKEPGESSSHELTTGKSSSHGARDNYIKGK